MQNHEQQQQQQQKLWEEPLLPSFSCRVSGPSLLGRRAASVPCSCAAPDAQPCHRLGNCERAVSLVAPGWGANRARHQIQAGPPPPALCPRRRLRHRMDHVARLPVAANPKPLPGLERSSFHKATALATAVPHLSSQRPGGWITGCLRPRTQAPASGMGCTSSPRATLGGARPLTSDSAPTFQVGRSRPPLTHACNQFRGKATKPAH